MGAFLAENKTLPSELIQAKRKLPCVKRVPNKSSCILRIQHDVVNPVRVGGRGRGEGSRGSRVALRKINASAGNRTRNASLEGLHAKYASLEGLHANHYTTDALVQHLEFRPQELENGSKQGCAWPRSRMFVPRFDLPVQPA